VVTPIGDSIEEVARRLFAGDQSAITVFPDIVPDRAVRAVPVTTQLPKVAPEHRLYDCRNSQLFLAAYQQIAPDVTAACERFGADRVGIVLGTSTSGISTTEKALATRHETGEYPSDYTHVAQEIGAVSEFAARVSGLRGPAYTISTACSSSAKVFASARSLIRTGICDAVLVGGVDSLCAMTLCGFSSLEAVDPNITNPMSANRAGINIGEAAVLFLLTEGGEGVELLGVGESSDAHHMSAPEPDGAGAEAAMRAALEDARLAPEHIDYVNLHGTGTIHNDSMESKAVARVFGLETPCSSTKALVGHTLGAAGAIEAAFCWIALSGGGDEVPLPPHLWDGCRDPELPAIRLVEPGDRGRMQRALSNSFAFGGSNCSVILGLQT
jgi:3-oxoacyl-[acyl-carrier-protein] synthase-1